MGFWSWLAVLVLLVVALGIMFYQLYWKDRLPAKSSSVDEGVAEKLHPGGQCIP